MARAITTDRNDREWRIEQKSLSDDIEQIYANNVLLI